MTERERTGAVYSNIDIEQAIREGRILIEPFDQELVNPASIDIRLFHEFKVFDSHRHTAIDPRNIPPDLMRVVEADERNPFVLHPNEFALGSTLEVVTVPPELTATLEGKSSLGRLGLIIHSTAGYVDPGWRGRLTLELANVSPLPILLYPGMRVGQLTFLELKTTTDMPYGSPRARSHYQGSMGPVVSKYSQPTDIIED